MDSSEPSGWWPDAMPVAWTMSSNRSMKTRSRPYTRMSLPHRNAPRTTVGYTADTTGRLNLHVEYPGESGEAAHHSALRHRMDSAGPVFESTFLRRGPRGNVSGSQARQAGVWSTDAFKDHAPYLMPQETGNHEEVRWAEITDENGHGLRVSRANGAAPVAVSLQPYSSFMIEEAQHQDELPAPKTCSSVCSPRRWVSEATIPGCRRSTPSITSPLISRSASMSISN